MGGCSSNDKKAKQDEKNKKTEQKKDNDQKNPEKENKDQKDADNKDSIDKQELEKKQDENDEKNQDKEQKDTNELETNNEQKENKENENIKDIDEQKENKENENINKDEQKENKENQNIKEIDDQKENKENENKNEIDDENKECIAEESELKVQIKENNIKVDESEQEELDEEQKKKAREDTFNDLQYITPHFLALDDYSTILAFIDSEYLQVLLQCQFMTLQQIISYWQVTPQVLYQVASQLYTRLAPNAIILKHYNCESMIKYIQKEMYSNLDSMIQKLESKNLKEFKNKEFSKKMLEVIGESYQLVFQQKKSTKQVSLYRQKEQYGELLVRKSRQWRVQGRQGEHYYQVMQQQIQLFTLSTPMTINWWNHNHLYNNLFDYLQASYFILNKLIKYELILSSEKSRPQTGNYKFGSKNKAMLVGNMMSGGKKFQEVKEGLVQSQEKKEGEQDISDNQIDKQDIDLDEEEIKNLEKFVQEL